MEGASNVSTNHIIPGRGSDASARSGTCPLVNRHNAVLTFAQSVSTTQCPRKAELDFKEAFARSLSGGLIREGTSKRKGTRGRKIAEKNWEVIRNCQTELGSHQKLPKRIGKGRSERTSKNGDGGGKEKGKKALGKKRAVWKKAVRQALGKQAKKARGRGRKRLTAERERTRERESKARAR
eukprot:6202221-Pleurochrysis_carterae.AAC.1